MQPTFGWWGNANTANNPITGQGNNCGVTGFTDHAADCETGLVYMQARHMDGVSSRFLSVDPQTMMSMDMHPGYVNRFGYTLNDPMNGIDPTGEFCVGACQTILAVHTGAAARNPGGYAAGVARGAPRAITGSIDMAMTYGPGASATTRAIAASPYGATNAYNEAIGPATSMEMALGEQTGEVAAEFAGGGAGAAKALSRTVVKSAESFFKGTKYADKVFTQMNKTKPDNHAFPENVVTFEGDGVVSTITGGDGVVREMLQIPGTYNGSAGNFTFIKEPDGMINHRLFEKITE